MPPRLSNSFMLSRMARLLSNIICAVFCLSAAAQQKPSGLSLRFAPVLGGRELNLANTGGGTVDTGMSVTMLRCYISGVSLWEDGKEVWREQNSYHLLDAEAPASLAWVLNVPPRLLYNAIHFRLGIDSATSSTGAHGGDLDPARGMYWAWQSGYVNFKLEGVSPQSTARKHQFHFHLGGYQAPYAAMQEVSLAVHPSSEIAVRMNLDEFLSGIDLAKLNSIMIPGKEAFKLSIKAAAIFHTP